MTDFFDAENLWPLSALDPVPSPDIANANIEEITDSATIITPAENVRSIAVISDKDIRVNPRGGAAVDDETCILVSANDHTAIIVTPGIAVNALSLSGTATVTATPMIRRRIINTRNLDSWMHPRSDLQVDARGLDFFFGGEAGFMVDSEVVPS